MQNVSKARHKCSACKKQFEWSAQSAWYGSYIELENGSVEKACGIECGKKLWGSMYPNGYKFDQKPYYM